MPGASNISKFLDGNSLRAIKTYVDGKGNVIFKGSVTAFPSNPSDGWFVVKDGNGYIYDGTGKSWVMLWEQVEVVDLTGIQ